MALSPHYSEHDLWAPFLAGSLPTGHPTQRSEPSVRGIPIDVVEVSVSSLLGACGWFCSSDFRCRIPCERA